MNEPRNYHHGNLRQALIEAALEVVERDGYQALSLRELAQQLEVSRGAPYRHFADRDALLTACACEGFRLLIAAHRKNVSDHHAPVARARAVGLAFLNFTASRPGLFVLMFDSGQLNRANEENELGALQHLVYEEVCQSLALTKPSLSPTALRTRMITMWSTLYGYARLRQTALLKPYMLEDLDTAELEEQLVAAAFDLPQEP